MKHIIVVTVFLLKVFITFSQSSVWEIEKEGANKSSLFLETFDEQLSFIEKK